MKVTDDMNIHKMSTFLLMRRKSTHVFPTSYQKKYACFTITKNKIKDACFQPILFENKRCMFSVKSMKQKRRM